MTLRSGQATFLSIELSTEQERLAQRYTAQILASRFEESTVSGSFQSVDPDTQELVLPRRVKIEQLALHTMEKPA